MTAFTPNMLTELLIKMGFRNVQTLEEHHQLVNWNTKKSCVKP
jgi:hypothetical protein